MGTPTTPPTLLTLPHASDMVPAKEAAQITHRSVQSLRRMVDAGEIQAFKVRRRLFFKRADLLALFQPLTKS